MSLTNSPTIEDRPVADVVSVKRFLLTHGVNDILSEILDVLAHLVCKCINDDRITLKKEYTRLTKNADKQDSLRVKLGYYIEKNYERVRDTVFSKYNYEIIKRYIGVKNFIEQMSIVYSAFYHDR